jgi:type IV pilus assembly protein PilV
MKIHRQTGFTLIEVLIAVLILGIGLLGLAGLQVNSMRNNHQAYLRSQATLLAQEMIDRMRTNRAGFEDHLYHLNTALWIDRCTDIGGCTAEQMAQHDLWQWQQSIKTIFPGCGNDICGVVCIDRTPDDGSPDNPQCQSEPGDDKNVTYVTKIWWNDTAEDIDNQLQRFFVAVQL